MTFENDVNIVRALPEAKWRDFVAGHPQSTIFHTPEMHEVFSRTLGHEVALWAAVDGSGDVEALLLPVFVTLMPGLLRYITTRAVVYGSVLVAPGEHTHALDKLLRAYGRQVGPEVLFTELRNLWDLGAVQSVLDARGFTYEGHLNYLIDVSCSSEQLMQNIGRRTRKNIRRQLRAEALTVEEVTHREQLDIFYALLQKTYALAQVPLVDRSLFEAAFDVLYPVGMVRFVLARVEQTYVAASVELLHKDIVYGWYGGVDREYTSYMPGEVLMWHILKWSAENGYRIYDFGGAGKPDETYGVRDFKAKFGGNLICYGRNICPHAPGRLWLSQQGYRVLRGWL